MNHQTLPNGMGLLSYCATAGERTADRSAKRSTRVNSERAAKSVATVTAGRQGFAALPAIRSIPEPGHRRDPE